MKYSPTVNVANALRLPPIPLFIQRSVCGAGSVVLTLFIHSESVPCARSENLFFGNIVHTYGDSEHRAERYEVCTDVAIGNCAVICAPAVHLKPDIFFVNSDGYTPGKKRFCEENGIELVVSTRIPEAGLPTRST